jgi:hypothetical protein
LILLSTNFLLILFRLLADKMVSLEKVSFVRTVLELF